MSKVAKLTEVEVQGMKFMVDMDTAKRIDSYKVGDPVKVLVKKYSDEYVAYYGMVIGFDNFENLPTIVIAYFESSNFSADAELKMIHLNDQSKGAEICHATDAEITLNPQAVVDKMNRGIAEARFKIMELENRKKFFLTNFSQVFGLNTEDIVDEVPEIDPPLVQVEE